MEAEIQAFLSTLESQYSYSRNTYLAYRADLLGFLEHLRKTLQRQPVLGDFNTSNVDGFLQAELSRGRRKTTLLRRLSSLKRFELYLSQTGRIYEKIIGTWAHHALEPVSLHTSPTLQVLTSDQINQLHMIFSTSRRSPASRDHAIFALLLETGLSVSALISLNLSDVDMRRGKIHLRLSDDEDCWLSLGDASKPLETYLREGRPEFHRVSGEPALFISQVGTRITRQGIWQILGYWGKQAGLPYILSPRLIRHTAVWRMTSSGRTIEQIQALIGHRNPLSTRALLYRLKRASLDQPR